jgi:hypothetical protein
MTAEEKRAYALLLAKGNMCEIALNRFLLAAVSLNSKEEIENEYRNRRTKKYNTLSIR